MHFIVKQNSFHSAILMSSITGSINVKSKEMLQKLIQMRFVKTPIPSFFTCLNDWKQSVEH